MSINDFLDMMPYTVTLMAPTGKNAQGLPTYVGGVNVSMRARIVGPVQDLRTPKGSERAELYTVWVASVTLIDADYKLTLPAAAPWNSRTPLIFSANLVTDERGMHHIKITCGFMYHRQGQT